MGLRQAQINRWEKIVLGVSLKMDRVRDLRCAQRGNRKMGNYLEPGSEALLTFIKIMKSLKLNYRKQGT